MVFALLVCLRIFICGLIKNPQLFLSEEAKTFLHSTCFCCSKIALRSLHTKPPPRRMNSPKVASQNSFIKVISIWQ